MLRLQIAGNGCEMIVDGGRLDQAFDMGEYGSVVTVDMTQSALSEFGDVNVAEVQWLAWCDQRVGIKLSNVGNPSVYFWVYDDEFYWGDETVFSTHDWLDGVIPTPSERIEV